MCVCYQYVNSPKRLAARLHKILSTFNMSKVNTRASKASKVTLPVRGISSLKDVSFEVDGNGIAGDNRQLGPATHHQGGRSG